MAATKAAYSGPRILAGGYRILFPLAALWAVLSVAMWVIFLVFNQEFGAGVDMFSWHAHGLVFGYGGAVVAGFALTAIPNWTGRTPVRGWALGALVFPWLVARVCELLLLGGYGAEAIRFVSEMIFFSLFLAVAAREVILGKNWRNLKVVLVFGLLVASAFTANLARVGAIELPFLPSLGGLVVLLVLITIIGGRIIPAFTANWLKGKGKTALPIMFNRFDGLAILLGAGVLVAFLMGAEGILFAGGCGLAAILHFIRLARWQGLQTFGSPIVLVLHTSYLWVPVGFLLLALASSGMVPVSAALHAWTIGGIGSTTLAVMSRASLGHAGLPLADSRLLTSLYVSINLAAISRVLAAVWPTGYDVFLVASAILWCTAFGLFLWRFVPLAFARR